MRRSLTSFVIGGSALLFAVTPVLGEGTDKNILFRYDTRMLSLGKFGSFADFQKQLFAKVTACGAARASGYGTANGQFGPETKQAIVDIQKCYPFGPALAAGPASDGKAVTDGLWEMLMGATPPPSAQERAAALTFMLEATDYDNLQYNFCQSKNPKTGKTYLGGDQECFSNDRSSYITWGPRGATAGHGAEIQQILRAVNNTNPEVVNASFGVKAEAMRRLINSDAKSVALILCSVWADPLTREQIRQSFKDFGSQRVVQSAYQKVYNSKDADGAKIERFYRIYAALRMLTKRDPTEIDFAFFLDRATHGGAPEQDIGRLISSLTAWIGKSKKIPSAGTLRRKIAELLVVSNVDQRDDRLARDVIYIIDDGEISIGDAERALWSHRSGVRASDFGLSDERTLASFSPFPSSGFGGRSRVSNATASERAKCPPSALMPKSPKSIQ